MKVTDKKASVNEFEKGIVTFLDVLGWKGLWQSNKEAVSQLKRLVRKTKNKLIKLYLNIMKLRMLKVFCIKI